MGGRRNGRMGGRRVREKVMGGVKGLSSRAEVREKVRGEYKFSSLMKPKKGKFYFVIYIAGIFCKKISVMK
jgi:hypothetical protein